MQNNAGQLFMLVLLLLLNVGFYVIDASCHTIFKENLYSKANYICILCLSLNTYLVHI
jgi:hypothetical protein